MTPLKLKEEEGKSPSEQVLPLVNIVFLLLIFFMITGVLRENQDFDIKPPSSSFENKAEISYLVLMNREGQLSLDHEFIDRGILRAKIDEALKSDTNLSVQVKADKDAPATELVALMDTLKKTELQSFNLVTANAN